MGNLGFQEMALIFVIALIFFGPRKLPEIGKTIGKSLAEFRKATTDLRNTWEEEIRKETESVQSAAGTAELTDTYKSVTNYDSYGDSGNEYGESNYPYGSTETSVVTDTPPEGASSDSPEPSTDSGRLEPNSSLEEGVSAEAPTDGAEGLSTSAQPAEALPTSESENTTGAVSPR